MRSHPAHVLEATAARKQAMGDAQHRLRADGHVEFRERVQRLGDHALRGVLHGHDAELGLVALHRRKHVGDARDAAQGRQLSELSQGRLVAERALRAQIGDPPRLLERPRGRDDLAKDGSESRIRERTVVGPGEAGHDATLAGGLVDRGTRGAFHLPHRPDESRARVELVQQGAIHRVDLVPQARELALEIGGGALGARLLGLGHPSFPLAPLRLAMIGRLNLTPDVARTRNSANNPDTGSDQTPDFYTGGRSAAASTRRSVERRGALTP